MIQDYFIYFIVFLILSYVFQDKILPQLAVFFAIVVMTIVYISEMTMQADNIVQNTIAIAPILLYVCNLFYTVANIIITPIQEKGAKNESV